MKLLYTLTALISLSFTSTNGAGYQDRFVWIFGWNLNSDTNVLQMQSVLNTAAGSGFNGAVASFGLDTLCKQDQTYFERLASMQQYCRDRKMDFIPAIFSVGYGGGALAHDRNLAEGVPVVNASFVVNGQEAVFTPESTNIFRNGGFEEYTGNKALHFNFHDQPGEISFLDDVTKRTGKVSMRLEHFGANPHGHGRVMQTIKVIPHRCYRVTFYVKTEDLQPTSAFRATVLASERNLAPREFHIPSATDWRKISFLFNSLDFEKVSLYTGLWGGKSGKVWVDDIQVEETGPVNVLRRPGTPSRVASADGGTVYEEGKDYAPLREATLQPFTDTKAALNLKLTPTSRIKDGQTLRVSWYHSMIIHDSQVTVCMAEPALYEIFDHEMKLLAEKVRPNKVLLNMDEVRMGGTCRACEGRDMAQMLGQCVTKQVAIVRKYLPDATVYIWSDMFDPNHNAKPNYYLVRGDYTGSWKYLPKNIVIAVWGGEPREKSLRFFADQGFQTLVACYYDADDLNDVRGWLELAKDTPNVRGFMYTPWLKKYSLLQEFGRLIK